MHTQYTKKNLNDLYCLGFVNLFLEKLRANMQKRIEIEIELGWIYAKEKYS